MFQLYSWQKLNIATGFFYKKQYYVSAIFKDFLAKKLNVATGFFYKKQYVSAIFRGTQKHAVPGYFYTSGNVYVSSVIIQGKYMLNY